MSRKTLVYMDIDGVLANCDHRLHYIDERDYEGFYSADSILADEVNPNGEKLISMLLLSSPINVDIAYITGRPERARQSTCAWFALNQIYPLPSQSRFGQGILYMREDGDHRDSGLLKPKMIVDDIIARLSSGCHYTDKEKKKIPKMDVEELEDRILKEYDQVLVIDDDPENIRAIEEVFPRFTCLVFGTSRIV